MTRAVRRTLYVYYRVRAGSGVAAEQFVLAMQRTLMDRQPPLRARLLRKDEPATTTPTWMETYAIEAHAAGDVGVDAELQAAIELAAAPLAPHLDGVRHVEAFLSTD